MSGGGDVNQIGIAVHGTPSQSFEKGVEKAGNPERLNRSSIEVLPEVEPKMVASPGQSKEFPLLSSRKVRLLSLEKFRLLLSRPKKQISLQKLGEARQQNKSLEKMFKQQEPEKAQNKTRADQQVRDLEQGLKWAKSNHKKAVKLAGPATLKWSVADKTGVPPQLNSTEREALRQLEQAKELVGKFKGKLNQARTNKDEFKTAEKLKSSFASRLEKLERKVSEASAAVNAKFTPLSVKDHKNRVADLGKKLADVEVALKDLKQLNKDVAAGAEKRAGVTPKDFSKKSGRLLEKAEATRTKGPEVLKQAKAKRDKVLEQQTAIKRAAKQAARDEKEMNKAFKKTRRSDQQQERQIQRKQEEAGRKATETRTPETQPQAKNRAIKKSAGLHNLRTQTSAGKPSVSQSGPLSSGLSGNVSWTPEDQALKNRLKRLRGQVVHEPITPSGNTKNFAQLEKQLRRASSVDDLKAVVADRRSSKITLDQQRAYFSLLSKAVMSMAENPQQAEQMNGDLIRDLLKGQPDKIKAAIEQMDKTHIESLQQRLKRLRSRE